MDNDQGNRVTQERAVTPPDPKVPPDPTPTGFFRRERRLKLLQPLPDHPELERRTIEIDIIWASADEWSKCEERHEPGWDPVERDGTVIAERTIG